MSAETETREQTVKRVDLALTCEITINDQDVIERVTGPKGDEWRAVAYNLHTEEDVLSHLAYNCLMNGVDRVNRLDGWGDLPDDAGTMQQVPFCETLEVADA